MLSKDKFDRLLSLSDSELRKAVSEAAISAGADKFLVSGLLADTDKLRNMLSGLSSEQVEKMLEKMPDNAARVLAAKLNEKR